MIFFFVVSVLEVSELPVPYPEEKMSYLQWEYSGSGVLWYDSYQSPFRCLLAGSTNIYLLIIKYFWLKNQFFFFMLAKNLVIFVKIVCKNNKNKI